MRTFKLTTVLLLAVSLFACGDPEDPPVNNNNVTQDAGVDADSQPEPDSQPDAEPPKRCNDGVDNDGDGLVDMNDPGCESPEDDDEYNEPPKQCNDGVDNDGDGLVDMNDPGCSSENDDDEYNVLSQCSDGVDNDGDGRVDMDDPGCSSPGDNDEYNYWSQCSDGVDNDGDGNIDMDDSGCSSPEDDDESLPPWCEEEPCMCTGGCSLGTMDMLGEFNVKEVWLVKSCNPSNPPPGCVCSGYGTEADTCYFDIYGSVDPCKRAVGNVSFGRQPVFGDPVVLRDILALNYDPNNNCNTIDSVAYDIKSFDTYEDNFFLDPQEFTIDPDGSSPKTYLYSYTYYENQKPRVRLQSTVFAQAYFIVLERNGPPGECSNLQHGQCYRTADCSAGDAHGLYVGCTQQQDCENQSQSGTQSWQGQGNCIAF